MGLITSEVGEKKALLIGLKHPVINTDIKGLILRMKKQLMDLRGFPEDNITLMIEDEPSCFQPTRSNIEMALMALVYHCHEDDILFIYIIGHGCKPGMIVTADKQVIDDGFFRIRVSTRGCAITILSDCQIEPDDPGKSMCCSPTTKQFTNWTSNEELIRQILKRDTNYISCGPYDVRSFNFPPAVDILKDYEKNYENVKKILDQAKHDDDNVVTPVSNPVNEDVKSLDLAKHDDDDDDDDNNRVVTPTSETCFGRIGVMLLELFKSFFSSTKSRISYIPTEANIISDSPTEANNISDDPHATILTAFECNQIDVTTHVGKRFFTIRAPKLFVPPPEVAFSTTASLPSLGNTLYGGFTNAILDVIEETHGRVTNIELARKAMAKLRTRGIHQKPGLFCEKRLHAYDSFVC